MKTGRFPWYARDGQTLDPKSLNENFRQGINYIRDALKMRYTYSMMTFNLTGLDLSAADRLHRFILHPNFPMEIVGGELVAEGYGEGESIYVRWVGPDEVASVVTTHASTGVVTTAVVLPNGGPTESWRWLEAEGSDNFDLAEDINQRALRIGDPVPIGVNLFSVEGVSPVGGKTATLNIRIRSDRGTDPDFDMPELFSGQDSADADKMLSLLAEMEIQRANAVGNLDTYRCEVIMGTGGMGVTGGTPVTQPLKSKMDSTIPSPTTSDGAWKLKRVDTGFVAGGAFTPGSVDRSFRTTVVKGGSPILTQDTELGDAGSGASYDEIFRWGDTISPTLSLTNVAASAVTNPVLDNELVNTELNTVVVGHEIETIYYYMWYSLE